MKTHRALIAAFLLLAGTFAGPAVAAQDVTIYRCVDAKGHESLRDTPCTAKETQKGETRTMMRPRDAEPRPEPMAPAAPPQHEAPVRERVSYATPPRPLYECITPDNMRYTSETSDGNPRWVPLWTLGYPLAPGNVAGVNFAFRNNNVGMSGGRTIITPPFYSSAAYGGGTWVRDTCYMLPQADVCARTRDRRDEIRRRFFNAMPSERDVLRVEERSLNARLEADCATE